MARVIFLTLALVGIVGTYGTDEEILGLEELIHQNPVCFKSSCNYSYHCKCDKDCLLYGDCCSEIILEYLRNSSDPRQVLSSSSKKWECKQFNAGDPWRYTASSCPSEWPDRQLSHRCSRTLPHPIYSHMLDIPVLSNTSNILYSNMYCAVCNRDADALQEILLSVTCNPFVPHCEQLLSTAQYIPGSLQWKSGNITILASIMDFPTVRACNHFQNGCSGTLSTDLNLHRDLCDLYINPVRIANETKLGEFKNAHCAACRGFAANATECSPPITFRKTIHYGDAVPQLPSFPLILDFSGGGNVGLQSRCATGQMFDSVRHTCIDYFCGKSYKMNEDGQCVAMDRAPSGNTTINSTELMGSCSRIIISQSEYRYVNESVIRVNRSGDEHPFQTELYEEYENGSVLICAPQTVLQFTDKFSQAQGIVSTICLVLSLACLTVHIWVYALVPKLRNLPGKNLLSLSCSIFMAQISFLVGFSLQEVKVLCIAIGVVTHLTYLSSFFWMNILAFDMFWTFTSTASYRISPQLQHRTFTRYSTYAWLCPLSFVSTALILDLAKAPADLRPRYAEPFCWFNSRTSLAIFLALPLLVLLIVNIIFFIQTAHAIKKATSDASFAVKDSTIERTRFFLYLKLAFILGLTWIFGFIAALTNQEFLWYLFIIFNSLQGVFIFFAFTFKRSVLLQVIDNLPQMATLVRLKEKAEQDATMTTYHTSELGTN